MKDLRKERKCATCSKLFRPLYRSKSKTKLQFIVTAKYCSEECARKAENARYYTAHRETISSRARDYKREHRKSNPARED